MRKASGAAEEYEEEREDECRMGKWEYVGREERVKRGEVKRYIETEADVGRRRGYDPQQNRGERRVEGQKRYNERRLSERETGWKTRRKDIYPRRNRVEAIVLHKAEQSETYVDILKKIKSNINIEELGIRDIHPYQKDCDGWSPHTGCG